ncbi:MAG: PadR family transcriptional regulator [Phenylobacterium sp.]|nr:MAG: PadR family transcriptional regulator [Phenylobacterium sp.]
MARSPQITSQTLKVLEAVISQPELSGAEVARITRLATGTLYPILLRLEGAGWLQSHWEEGDPQVLGRPRRRFYSVTAEGARAARNAAAELQPMIGRLSWA